MIMDNIVAYEKFEWEKILQLIDKMSFAKKEYMANFNKKWCPHFTLCVNYHCKTWQIYQIIWLSGVIN